MSYFPRVSKPSTPYAMGNVVGGSAADAFPDSLKTPPPPTKSTKSAGSGTSWWDRLGGAAGGVLDYLKSGQDVKSKELELAIAQQRAMAQQGGTPGWVLPAVAVAGVVGAVVLLRKK